MMGTMEERMMSLSPGLKMQDTVHGKPLSRRLQTPTCPTLVRVFYCTLLMCMITYCDIL